MGRKTNNMDREFDTVQHLRHENNSLKKEVKKLRKELSKVNIRYEGLDDLVQQQYQEEFPEAVLKSSRKSQELEWTCHKCKEDFLRIIIINRPDGVYYLRKCGSCAHKTRLKKYNDKVEGIFNAK